MEITLTLVGYGKKDLGQNLRVAKLVRGNGEPEKGVLLPRGSNKMVFSLVVDGTIEVGTTFKVDDANIRGIEQVVDGEKKSFDWLHNEKVAPAK